MGCQTENAVVIACCGSYPDLLSTGANGSLYVIRDSGDLASGQTPHNHLRLEGVRPDDSHTDGTCRDDLSNRTGSQEHK